MKKILSFAMLMFAGLPVLMAQQKENSVDDLITSKHFAFVVTEMKSVPIYTNAYTDRNDFGTNYPMNLSLASQTAILSGKAENYTQNAFGQGQILPSYYSRYGIEQYPKTKDRYNKKQGEGVYMLQLPDGVLISGDKVPADFEDIVENDFYAYQQKDIKSNIRKADGKWQIIYTVGTGKDKRKFEMNIAADGMAVLKTEPVGDKRRDLYGHIVDSRSLQFEKEK